MPFVVSIFKLLLRREHGIPAFHCRDAPVVAENIQRCRIEKEVTSCGGWKSKPARRKDSENMAVREKGDMPFLRAHSCDHSIGPSTNLLRAFTAGTAVVEKHPPGPSRTDLVRGETLVFPVVPFHQIAVDFSALAESGQLTSLPSAPKRAAQY
jgi:hypothetical protein